jgi:hypothetical protein
MTHPALAQAIQLTHDYVESTRIANASPMDLAELLHIREQLFASFPDPSSVDANFRAGLQALLALDDELARWLDITSRETATAIARTRRTKAPSPETGRVVQESA